MSRICRVCNKVLSDDENFCTNCGSNNIKEKEETINRQEGFAPPSSFDLRASGQSNTEISNSHLGRNPFQPKERTSQPHKNINTKKIFTIILVIIGTLLIIMGMSYLLEWEKKKNQAFNPEEELNFEEVNNVSLNSTNSYRVGDNNYGYISIPLSWTKLENGDEDMLQYTDNTSWVVTSYYLPTSQINAITWANNIYSLLQKNKAKNINVTTLKINELNVYQVNGYYEKENTYLSTWCFDTKNGYTHYLALEGITSSTEYYDIIYTFKEDR